MAGPGRETSHTARLQGEAPSGSGPATHPPCSLGGEPAANPDLRPGQPGRVAGAGLLVAWCRLLSVPGARLEWQRTLITLRPLSLRLSRAERSWPLASGGGEGDRRVMRSTYLPEECALGFHSCPWLLPLGPACALGEGRSVSWGCRLLPVSAWHAPPCPRSAPRGPRPP